VLNSIIQYNHDELKALLCRYPRPWYLLSYTLWLFVRVNIYYRRSHVKKRREEWWSVTAIIVIVTIFISNKITILNECRPFCVLKKWVHSRIGQCVRPSVRPSVYTITLHNYIRLSWNFVHRMVSSISPSSSKMRIIRQEMAELSTKLLLLTRPSLRGTTGIFSKKIFFSELFI
jgi:glucan phosphoethanolaminetransferase (alkaline phosphatase superfamily)